MSKKIFVSIAFALFMLINIKTLYSSSDSNDVYSYFNKMTSGDTVHITITVYYHSRARGLEEVKVYKTMDGFYASVHFTMKGSYDSDTTKTMSIKLDKDKMDILKAFEKGIKSQNLHPDGLFLRNMTEFIIRYKSGYYVYSDYHLDFSLIEEWGLDDDILMTKGRKR